MEQEGKPGLCLGLKRGERVFIGPDITLIYDHGGSRDGAIHIRVIAPPEINIVREESLIRLPKSRGGAR